MEIGVHAGPAGDEQLVPPFSYRQAPDDLSQAPLHAVAVHRFCGDSPPDHEAEPGQRQGVGDGTQHEEWMGSGYAALAERLEVALATESLVTVERLTDASLTSRTED